MTGKHLVRHRSVMQDDHTCIFILRPQPEALRHSVKSRFLVKFLAIEKRIGYLKGRSPVLQCFYRIEMKLIQGKSDSIRLNFLSGSATAEKVPNLRQKSDSAEEESFVCVSSPDQIAD